MTLVAFACYSDRAEVLTDTASYTPSLSRIGRCTKQRTLHHLDTVVLTQGEGTFGDAANYVLGQLSDHVADASELASMAPELLRHAFAPDAAQASQRLVYDSMVAIVGWSTADARFRAYLLTSEQDFEPVDIRGLWLMPMPWTHQPTDLELDRFTRWCADSPDGDPKVAQAWQRKPKPQKPRDKDDWVHLGRMAREQRSASGPFNRVLVAGDLLHTRLERGSATTRTAFRFDDDPAGEEFQRIVVESHHPTSQVAPCWCDSGRRFIDCHLQPWLDHPCDCGSLQPFRGCCAVTASA